MEKIINIIIIITLINQVNLEPKVLYSFISIEIESKNRLADELDCLLVPLNK